MHGIREVAVADNGAVTYRERLWPTPWLLIACLLLVPAGILVFAPIQLGVGIAGGIALYAIALGWLLGTSPLVAVDRVGFRAGRALLPLEHVGAVEPIDGAAATIARGTGLDARAFTLFRGWIPGVVRVENTDPADPAPYWLVSTRRPVALAAALETARASA